MNAEDTLRYTKHIVCSLCLVEYLSSTWAAQIFQEEDTRVLIMAIVSYLITRLRIWLQFLQRTAN